MTREGLPPDQTAPTYTTKRFSGALNSVNLVAGSLDQLDGVVAEIFIWNDFRLRWNLANTRWDVCVGDNGEGGCNQSDDFTSQLLSLQMTGQHDRHWVNIGGCTEVEGNFTCSDFVFDSDDDNSENDTQGFYHATHGNDGPVKGEVLDTGALQDGFELWASVGGQTYIEYVGFGEGGSSSGWVEKTLSGFDDRNWQPEFDDTGDKTFHFEMGREYFVNQRGSNLRVTRVAEAGSASDYNVYMEVHQVAKPVSTVTDVIAAGSNAGISVTLADGWDPESGSKYRLNLDSTSANYLLLEYASISDLDSGEGVSVGDVVTQDMWGLRIDGDSTSLASATLYNWEYQAEGDNWGGVTYLLDQSSEYVLLDEPMRFEAVTLARTDDIVQSRDPGEWLSFSLAYDGWLHGVPDPWFELQRIGFEGEGIAAVLANNVRIPDGTELTDSDDASTYYVKAIDIGIFLGSVNAFPSGEGEPDISQADAVNLDSDLPTFVAPTLSATLPSGAEQLYVEGQSVTKEEEGA